MKKLLSLITIMICCVSMTACNSKIVNSGRCGDTVNWSFYDDNTLVISGNGQMKEYYNSVWYEPNNVLIPWHFYTQQANKIVVEDGVESICAFAFIDAKLCTEIEISESVVKIGHCAFEHMNSLERIIISKSVKELGSMVFHSGYYDVYYAGTQEDFEKINIIENSGYSWDSEFYGTLYYYSEIEKPGCWHYVNNQPAIWD